MKGWDENGVEWHWYQNKGKKVGLKQAGEPDPVFDPPDVGNTQ